MRVKPNPKMLPFPTFTHSLIPHLHPPKKKLPLRIFLLLFTSLYLIHLNLSTPHHHHHHVRAHSQSGPPRLSARWFRPRHISAHNATCANLRYARINALANSTNDFIPYLCYNHNNRFITMLGMALRPFQKSALSFSINGHPITHYALHHAQAAFAFNAGVSRSHLARGRNQMLAYTVHGCEYRLECPNYFETRRDNFNLCVYTMRSAAQLNPFLRFYSAFVDRIFIYNTNPRHSRSFDRLRAEAHKYRVVPWYLHAMRDANISKRVYRRLITYRVGNSRNYPRDLQKVQTNDCMYRNRDTDMVLMVDDDEYLNYHNRKFYDALYHALKHRVHDIVFKRNFCNSTVRVINDAELYKKPRLKCDASKKKRLEKGIVLPRNCPLYEIHRCVTRKSFYLRGVNIYAAHKPYPLPSKEVREQLKRERL